MLSANILAQGIGENQGAFSSSTLEITSFYDETYHDPVMVNFLLLLALSLGVLSLLSFIVGYIYRGGFSKFFLYSGMFFFATGLVAVILVFYVNVLSVRVTPVFSVKDMTGSIWSEYKSDYIEAGTFRVIDRERNNVTTSEGQSYVMLRSVWMDDRETFDAVWNWTRTNLQRPDNSLFAWLYGLRPNGTYGVLMAENGNNSASDADCDLALALLFAYSRWQDPQYLEEAQKIIKGIWSAEVITVGGRPYLAASNAERNSAQGFVINPSYLAPYAYRIFERVDPEHDWAGLVDTSYEVIMESIREPLDKSVSAYLPPDWLFMNRSNGRVSAVPNSTLATNYSYDALRLPWRLALDYEWYKDGRALEILKQFGLLNTEWESNRVIHSSYAHDGKVVAMEESPAMYGGSIFAIRAIDPENAKDIYERKLVALFNPDSQSWKFPLGYYNENWAWFGISLYNSLLPNLWEGESTRVR